MAGLMDMLGKKTETENGSSYQKVVIREIARKLAELEEQNDQNAMAVDEIRKMQKTVIQKLDSLKAEQDSLGRRAPTDAAGMEGTDELQRQIRTLTQQLQTSVQNLDGKIQVNGQNLDTQLQSLDGKLSEVLDQVSDEKQQEDGFLSQDELLDKLDMVRLSLEDTVHKENIKCFRNVQGALEEQGDGKAYDLNALRKYLKVIVWFQLITIVILVLQSLGLL